MGPKSCLMYSGPIFRIPSRAESGLPGVPAWMLSARQERCFPERALAFVSDLVLDDSCLTIAVTRTSLPKLQEACGTGWIEAAWYESCPLEVEVWAYPIDMPSDISFLTAELSSIDLLNLYVACSKAPLDDIRYQDALAQLKEKICHLQQASGIACIRAQGRLATNS